MSNVPTKKQRLKKSKAARAVAAMAEINAVADSKRAPLRESLCRPVDLNTAGKLTAANS